MIKSDKIIYISFVCACLIAATQTATVAGVPLNTTNSTSGVNNTSGIILGVSNATTVNAVSSALSRVLNQAPNPAPMGSVTLHHDLSIDAVHLMGSARITVLDITIQNLDPSEFYGSASSAKGILHNDLARVNDTVLIGAYYDTYNTLNQTKNDVKSLVKPPTQDKIVAMLNDQIESLKIETSPTNPFPVQSGVYAPIPWAPTPLFWVVNILVGIAIGMGAIVGYRYLKPSPRYRESK